MPRNILIFSDGTGQAGGLTPDERISNIYKLYRAARVGPELIDQSCGAACLLRRGSRLPPAEWRPVQNGGSHGSQLPERGDRLRADHQYRRLLRNADPALAAWGPYLSFRVQPRRLYRALPCRGPCELRHPNAPGERRRHEIRRERRRGGWPISPSRKSTSTPHRCRAARRRRARKS